MHCVPFRLSGVQLPVCSERGSDLFEELGPEGGLVEGPEKVLLDGVEEESPAGLVVVLYKPGPMLVGVVEVFTLRAP